MVRIHNREDTALALMLLAFGLGLLTAAAIGVTGDNTDYTYTVKAEQVEQGDHFNVTDDYDDLSDAERQLLHDAFKKSDHFLGGAEAHIRVDEPVDGVSTEWKVVSIEGVPVLMSIQGPDTRMSGSMFLAVFGFMFGIMATVGGGVGLKNNVSLKAR